MMNALYIGIAGGLGSMSRYWLGNWVSRQWGDKLGLPLGTLSVNILGSLLMGLLVGIAVTRGDFDARTRLVLGVGFLGGFTTYSSFAMETVDFLEKRSPAAAASYIALTLMCAGFACFVGVVIGKRI
jgi:CrcB protein